MSSLAAGLVLAGGHGRRAGGPKALKIIDGELLWRAQVRRLQDAGVAPIVAVLHPSAAEGAGALDFPGRIEVADADRPMFASLQQGLRALIDHDAPVVMHPVDAGVPALATIEALLNAMAGLEPNQQVKVMRPLLVDGEEAGRRGHPIVLMPDFCAELLAMDGDAGRLDHVIAALRTDHALDVPTSDAAIRANYNFDGIAK